MRRPLLMRPIRRFLPIVAALGLVLGTAATALADDAVLTFSPEPGTTVYDETGSLSAARLDSIRWAASAAADATGLAPIFYFHRVPAGGRADASGVADALVGAWADRTPPVSDTAVVLIEMGGDPLCPADIAVRTGSAYQPYLSPADAERLTVSILQPFARTSCDPYAVAVAAAVQLTSATMSGLASSPTVGADAPAVGPPFPDHVAGRWVYDEAGVFSGDTIARTQATIDAIEARTGAQIAVYTQLKPGATTGSTEQDAIALMDQWGVGRKGFDDGLVILWNLDETLRHGQIQLYAGPGFRNLISNEQRQAIYQDDMTPLLFRGDLDGAMLAAIGRINELMTPENAARLQFSRVLNAVLGLIVAPLLFILLAGWAVVTWYRRGRDPYVAPSESMFMPAPPTEMTAATGALVLDGRISRRALTTAVLDLASRGDIAFRQEEGGILRSTKVGIEMTEPDPTDARVALNRRATLGPAEQYALAQLQRIGKATGYIEPTKLLEFGEKVQQFDSLLQKSAVTLGWFSRAPSSVMGRWMGLGTTEIILGFVLFIVAVSIPADSLTLIALAVGAAGVITLIAGYAMPARTIEGARVRVWLGGYRRTLEQTMAQARSMDQVVAQSGLTWLETPDQAVVWGTALGLQGQIEQVLQRSIEDVAAAPQAGMIWLPMWYHSSSGASWGTAGAGGIAPGLMSGSAIPDFGSMIGAIGSVGNAPSSSGGGGGGGGGGSGGGGGGAGGGF